MAAVVSVIIPARNSARTLPATLESCVAQSYPHLDVVVVDDGSTDQTFEIASSFPDARIRCLRGPGRGAAAARNAGMRQAIGRYIQFLDSDDLLSREKIEEQLRVLLAHPGHVASCRWSLFSDISDDACEGQSSLFRDLSPIEYVQRIFSPGGWFKHHMQTACWLAPLNIINDTELWDERCQPSEDCEFFMRVVMRSRGVCFVEKAHVFWRDRPDSFGKQMSVAHTHGRMTALDKMIELAFSKNVPDISCQALADRYRDILLEDYPSSRPLERALMQRIERLGELRFGPGMLGRRWCSIVGWRAVRRAQLFGWRLMSAIGMGPMRVKQLRRRLMSTIGIGLTRVR